MKYYFFIPLLLFMSLQFTSLSYSQSLNQNVNSISDSLKCQTEIEKLKFNLLKTEVQLAKKTRTLGWVIATPAVSWTLISTALAIENSLTKSDYLPFILTTVGSVALAYIGIDMILESNEKLTELENINNNTIITQEHIRKTFSVSFVLHF